MDATNFSISDNIIIYSFFSIVGAYIIFLFIKKLFLWNKYRLSYSVFTRLTPKKIANIAMITATSISIIFLLTILSSGLLGLLFRVYPSWRSLIEGILIKLGGLVFGPIVGIFIGGLTDILTVLLTAGMFHYGYFIAALAYGFCAGIVRNIILTKKSVFTKLIFTSIFGLVSCIVTNLYLFFAKSLSGNVLSLTIFKLNISITTLYACIYLDVFVIVTGLILWTIFLFKNRVIVKTTMRVIKYKRMYSIPENKLIKKLIKEEHVEENAMKLFKFQVKHFNKIFTKQKKLSTIIEKADKLSKNNFLNMLLPVICVVFFGEQIINITIMPTFDYQLGGGVPFDSWVLIRVLSYPLLGIVNIFVIWPCYKVISKFIDVTPATEIYKKY